MDKEQTGTWQSGLGNFVGAVLDSTGYGNQGEPAIAEKPDNTLLYVGGGIGLALLVGFFMIKK